MKIKSTYDAGRAYDVFDDKDKRRTFIEVVEEYNDLVKTCKAFRRLALRLDPYGEGDG